MTSRTILLIAHVGAAMLLIGPATVGSSLFPRHALAAAGDAAERATARLLARVTRVYGGGSFAVGVFGVALGRDDRYWAATWLQVAAAVFLVGLGLLLGVVVPRQRRVCAALDRGEEPDRADIATLRSVSGVYALSWLLTLVLMVAKPWP